MKSSKLFFLLVIVALCCMDPSHSAAGKGDGKKNSPEKAKLPPPVSARVMARLDAEAAFEKKMMAALRKKVTVKLDDVTIEEAAYALGKASGLKFECDVMAFEEEGVDVKAEAMVDLVLKEVQLATVLDLLRLLYEIDWNVRGDRLVLTTITEVEMSLICRHYVVDDFEDWKEARRIGREDARNTRKWIADLKKNDILPETLGPDEAPFPKTKHDYKILRRQSTMEATGWHVEEFIEMIMYVAGTPDPGWAEDGGLEGAEIKELPGVPSTSLMVTQTRRTHWQIAELISDLRAIQRPGTVFRGRPAVKYDFISEKPCEDVIKKMEQPLKPLDIAADTTMSEVIEYISDKLGIPIIVNSRALEEEGMTPKDVKAVKDLIGCRTGTEMLDRMLRPHDLGWVILRDVVVVTTLSDEWNHMQTRVFDISGFYENPDRAWDYESIIEMIKCCSAVPEPGWAEDGGLEGAEIKEFPANGITALVIRQTPDGMREVEEALGRIYRSGFKSPAVRLKGFQSYRENRHRGGFGGGMMGGGMGDTGGMF